MLAFVRVHGADRVLCVFHRGETATEKTLAVGPELPDGNDYRLLPGGQKVTVKGGRASLVLPARSPLFVTNVSPAKAP